MNLWEEFTSVEELSWFLRKHWVETSLYGTQLSDGRRTKEIGDLLKEIQEWEATLELDEATWDLVRRIRVLNIRVLFWDLELYEEKQVFKDGQGNETNQVRIRDNLKVAVSEKLAA